MAGAIVRVLAFMTMGHDYNLLGRDGTHLSRRGKRIFRSRLANLVPKALN